MRAGVSKKLSNCARQSYETIHGEVVLDIVFDRVLGREEEDVVFIAGAVGVVVEVVYHQARPVLRKHNVHFKQKAGDGARDSALARKSEEHVGSGIDEFDDQVGCQGRAQAF
jgi:hypothetical protein